MRITHRYIVIVISAVLFFSSIAEAQLPRKEFLTLGRILTLSKDIQPGDVFIDVLYNPNNPDSMRELKQIETLLTNGFKTPRNDFYINPISDASQINIDSKIIYLTKSLKDRQVEIASQTALNNQQLTITMHVPYIASGHCILGINIQNRVEIFINYEALIRSGLQFDTAFKFMVKYI